MTQPASDIQHDNELLDYRLSLRLGATHARQRLSIEREFEGRLTGPDGHLVHIEKWYSFHQVIRGVLRLSGMMERGQRNARRLKTIDHRFVLPQLPLAFEGFRILHLTDLHADMDAQASAALVERVKALDYDLCVLTGDYRRLTWGPIEGCMAGMARLRDVIKGTPLAVLGNHDSIRMLPAMEDMGYQLLVNEHTSLERNGERLTIAGVDDAHFYKVHNLQKASDDIPPGDTTLLLSHTPEIWMEAAHAGFDMFLCGHTHGGQICLPGGIPLTLDADCPRRMGKGSWKHAGMQGYTSVGAGTSVVNVRINCPPEVTIHTLTRGPG
jgi:hypothetical protein